MIKAEQSALSAARRYVIIFALAAVVGGSGMYVAGPLVLGIGKIAGCRSNHYSDDSHLAYCASTGYGDYEHGAFYFDTEPTAHQAIERAEVVFFGNSVSQFAFSTTAVSEIFRARGIHYYLLGFAYFETIDFAQALVPRSSLHPRVAVLNADYYFWARTIIDRLATIDGVHLDRPSAESWSRAFVQELLQKTAGCFSPRE